MTMKLSSFGASFHDYELDLDYYHGKDVVHQGCLLKLDSTYSWDKINSRTRNKIRKAQQLDIKIEKVKGTPEDIQNFRKIWFDPKDPTIPEQLDPDEIMYLAYKDSNLTGGLILTPSSRSVLYMHNLGADEQGKKDNIPGLLLWHAVENLQESEYEYIDVGVSFRPTLYKFFKNWQTDTYPIIFNPPFIAPDIRLTPAMSQDVPVYKGATDINAKIISEYFGEEFTILPRAIYCLKAALKHLNIERDENVAVFKTFDNDYITRCVSDTIENQCQLNREINDKTKAVLVIHEFGHPCAQTQELKKQCEAKEIPLIEDCAWTCDSRLADGTKVGDVGDYAIFSLPKVFALPYGGVLKGLAIDDEENWNNYQLLDYFKRELVTSELSQRLPDLTNGNERRRENWQHLARLFAQDGFEPFYKLEEGVYPGAFVVKIDDFQGAFERFETFGIEAGRYYQGKALFLPVHQNLNAAQLDYIYGVFRGKLNLSSGYRRDIKK